MNIVLFIIGGIVILFIILAIILIISYISTVISMPIKASKKAKDVLNLYYEALIRKDFLKASKYISPLVLSTNEEKKDWIERLHKEREFWNLISYEIGEYDFGTLSGKYVRQVYYDVTLHEDNNGMVEFNTYKIRLSEYNEKLYDLYIISCPEISNLESKKLEENYLSLIPTRKIVS